MDRWYYLADEQFEQINRLLPPEEGRRGRPPTVKNREALKGVLHVPRTGTPWRDLPNAYGPWHTISMRWQRWIERALWGEILKLLQRLKGVDLTLVFLDSPVVRAHQHAAMDKAYDSNAIRAKPDAKGITPVIPPSPIAWRSSSTTRNATSSATKSSAFLTNANSSAESLPAMKNSKPTSWLSSPSPSS